jgi:formylglycine-generating enzyme required for sulfatase activity
MRELVQIEGGSFDFRNSMEAKRDGSTRIKIEDLYIDRYQITQADWYAARDEGLHAELKVYRGGSFLDFEYGCTVFASGKRKPNLRQTDIGFRIARNRVSFRR